MNFSDFFIWCAGSDTELLAHCSKKERNKHIGYGTLVLVPAVLAFVSMSFALSTVELIAEQPLFYYLGGFIWALIIFSFDRFIVSTHVRKMDNVSELRTPVFYLRFGFTLILGIVISHPLVMLYFNGSIQDQITENTITHQKLIEKEFDNKINAIEIKKLRLDSMEQNLLRQRDAQAAIVAKEIDGEVIKNEKGETTTTGIYGKGPSAENKIKQLNLLTAELQEFKANKKIEFTNYDSEILFLKTKRDSTVAAFSVSSDYIRRELALEQLKEKHGIVSITQYFLIALFILVDILPFIFKTFSPFGMYDKILLDDDQLVREIDNSSRKVYLEEQYNQINEVNL